MTLWQRIGFYCDREIFISKINSVSQLSIESSLSSTSLLVCFSEELRANLDVKSAFENLIKTTPLCISLAGSCAEIYFDLILEIMSESSISEEIMTNLSDEVDISEWIFDFLSVTYPSEDRFDAWSSYHIAVIGSDNFYKNIMTHVIQFLSN